MWELVSLLGYTCLTVSYSIKSSSLTQSPSAHKRRDLDGTLRDTVTYLQPFLYMQAEEILKCAHIHNQLPSQN